MTDTSTYWPWPVSPPEPKPHFACAPSVPALCLSCAYAIELYGHAVCGCTLFVPRVIC